MARTTTKMTSRKIDIIRQPIPTLLATFGVLVTLLTIRSVRSPHPAEVATDFLSPLGVWLNGINTLTFFTASTLGVFTTF